MSTLPAFLRDRSAGMGRHDTRKFRSMTLVQLGLGAPWKLSTLHDRHDDLLIWVTKGQGRVIMNGVRRGIGTHNAVFLPAGTLWSVDLGPQSFAQVVTSPPGLIARLPKQALHLRIRDSLAQAEILAEIEAMQREITRDRPLLQDALEAHVRLIAVWLQRQMVAGAIDLPKDTAAHRLVRRFVLDLVRDFRTDRVMADYAAALDVTPTHLTRVCRAACGKTASEMLVERRLYEARLLLSAPAPAIREIASDLGFHSAAYFTRFIQTHTGLTPSALRKHSLGQPTR
ncbi:AraC family transcriptional regulator [Puniceibacterium sp. IMCC21224]|uniref:helix-turn-helix transcriptional regulator n=1 Tax=Puniceibacterium sp. IMCC21224 TaxID=1618204 RepID=UPI00065CD17B|nr:helix-turn-helix domain-containing protein [Puniceibacterium sp. IMCC21224]KMK67270.1 transcriptional regulator, AraC family [Puniceibacterium sp. IMCC21224]